MEDILQIVKENNLMLKVICQYLANKEKTENYKNLSINLVSNWFTDNLIEKLK